MVQGSIEGGFLTICSSLQLIQDVLDTAVFISINFLVYLRTINIKVHSILIVSKQLKQHAALNRIQMVQGSIGGFLTIGASHACAGYQHQI
jgi:hypothetical protein